MSTRICPCPAEPLFFSAARGDANFRSGLLQGFGVANKLAKSQACLVRKFAVLTSPLSVQNGELNLDGSVCCLVPPPLLNTFKPCPPILIIDSHVVLQVNRAGVKRKHLKIVEEMFPK